ncbi:AraC family transcriptional regulator [Sulfurovum sp. NBC37-1]|uniref:AraC family transcriptional regulator n=1 Tax=Sulfurovum sp. (strain NBC37-1) TaxID=387093 RepID=UPI00015876E8|nr:AraC family transcriptional regulator [Sulfurovum sp. NBC37-1]BAF71912.1 hypothetical protein SUN_0955 [Sulfurovum sp. NBC37-1]
MTTKKHPSLSVDDNDFFKFTFTNFREMEEFGKNWSFYCRYRFGVKPFKGTYNICQNEDFQIASAVYHDGMMYNGYAPTGAITLTLIIDKEGSLTANGKILNAGEILVLDDSDAFEIAFSHPIRKGVISLSKDFVDMHFPYLHQMLGRVYADRDDVLKDLILSLEENTEFKSSEIRTKLIEVLKFLSLDTQEKITKKLSKKEALIFDVRDYIIKLSEDNIPIEDLAKKFGMSERTLQTGFKKIFGYTPKKFTKLLKLNLAHRDIVKNDGSKTISEIAMKYGFGNFGLFAQEFKRIYGVLPSESTPPQILTSNTTTAPKEVPSHLLK